MFRDALFCCLEPAKKEKLVVRKCVASVQGRNYNLLENEPIKKTKIIGENYQLVSLKKQDILGTSDSFQFKENPYVLPSIRKKIENHRFHDDKFIRLKTRHTNFASVSCATQVALKNKKIMSFKIPTFAVRSRKN